MLVTLKKASRGLALVDLKGTGCDVWQLECQASNVTASVAAWIHVSSLFRHWSVA